MIICNTLLLPEVDTNLKHALTSYILLMVHDSCIRLKMKIKWGNRFAGNSSNACNVSVDVTDFHIHKPNPFSPQCFSQKFKGPELRYEVAVCILNWHIVWTHGPFACGSYPYLTIYRIAIKSLLTAGEKVVADEGYKDPTCFLGSDFEGEHRKILVTIRA